MNSELLIQTIQQLKDFEKDKTKEIAHNIITENGADEYCDLINYEIENTFNLLFGRENSIVNENDENENGILKDFNFKDDSECRFAVMVSYWNYIKAHIDHEKIDDKRKNSFYKGRRWSESNIRKNFYFYFNILKDCLGSENVPVSFLVKLFIGKYNYIKIITTGEFNTNMDSNSPTSLTLYFPNLYSGVGKVIQDLDYHELNNFLSLICKYKAQKDSHIFDRNRLITVQIKDEISNSFERVINDYYSLGNNIPIKKYILQLKDNIKDIAGKECNEIDLLKMLLLYQYYDIPYSMHFFLPNENAVKIQKEYCCLAFSTPTDYSFEHTCIINWVEYINIVENILSLRENIWNNINADILRITNIWKTYYNENKEKYERLSSVSKNIFQALCERPLSYSEDKIDVYQITHRVKEFDSLFKKIISRANSKDINFPDSKDPSNFYLFNPENFEKYSMEKDNDKKNELRDVLINEYRYLLLNPTQINIKRVFGAIKDVVGLRIVCKFQQDVDALHKIFIDSKDEKYAIHTLEELGIVRTSIKKGVVQRSNEPNEMGYYYTSNHYTFKLSEERSKLIEFCDLCDITFELQVRTTLSQGISDVSHELFYKPKLPEGIKQEFRDSIKTKIESNSWKIKESDIEFSELKKQYLLKRGKNK